MEVEIESEFLQNSYALIAWMNLSESEREGECNNNVISFT